jgi:hypothetical protein
MEKCYICETYSAEYDEMCQEWDDRTEFPCHHCVMYDGAIPQNIVNGEEICPFFYCRERQ